MARKQTVIPIQKLIVEQQNARQQYLSLKAHHPDCLLLFRQGDCYEAFDDDAKRVAEVCVVALTSYLACPGRINDDVCVPLACVPVDAIEDAVTQLVNAGHRVAVAEPVTQAEYGQYRLL